MKSLRFSFLITVLLMISWDRMAGQEFHISITVTDLPDKAIILSHRMGMKFFTDDTVKTDLNGSAVFEGPALMPEGMYQIVFPDKKFVEFFLGPNQKFSLKTKSSFPTDSLTFAGSEENSRFLVWQRKYGIVRSRISAIQNRFKQGNLSPDSTALLNRELQKLHQSNNDLWDKAVIDLAGTLPGSFIRGLKPVRMPESLGKQNTTEGQMKQYNYVRAHFFDGVDFPDERLLRTPLIETKLDQYFKQILPQIPDTIIREARRVIELARPSKTMFQFVVQYLFNLYTDPVIMGIDAVYVYIAENYYLAGETPWIDSANLRGIRSRVSELKPLLLGSPAPLLDGLVNSDEQPVEIKDIKSKYLILYFWSPDCGFCKEATPKLHKQYADLQQLGFEVIAVNTRVDKESWTKFIAEHQLNWINVYSPQKFRDIIQKYQAFSTPTLYILDSERRIIAKNISVDQVKTFFDQYQASQKPPLNAR